MPPPPDFAAFDRELSLARRPGGLRAVVRTRVLRGTRVYAAAAGVGWALMLFFAVRTARDPETPPAGFAFMAFWIANMAMSGPIAIWWILSSRGGREVIEVAGRSLRIRRNVKLREPERALDAARVVNLRAEVGPPHVAFDHGTERFRVGEGLSREDAGRLAEALRTALLP